MVINSLSVVLIASCLIASSSPNQIVNVNKQVYRFLGASEQLKEPGRFLRSVNPETNNRQTQQNYSKCKILKPTRGLYITRQLQPQSNVIRFTCASGYNLRGASSLSCLSNGNWSGYQPTCSVACILPKITEALIITKYRINNLRFNCEDGYVLKGTTSSYCTSDGSWSKTPPICSLPACELPRSTGLKAVRILLPNRERVTFSCEDDYITFGDALSSTCFGNNTWSFPPPSCRLPDCPLPEKTNGLEYKITTIVSRNDLFPSDHFNTTSYTVDIEFSCANGYILKGITKTFCLSSGSWRFPPPTCSFPVCSMPNVTNGLNIAIRNFTLGKVLVFSCSEGYILRGAAATACLITGKWSNPTPTCELPACTIPQVTEGLNITRQLLFNNEMIVFTCAPGYILHGVTSSVCSINGTWSNAPPNCSLPACTVPQPTKGLNITRELLPTREILRFRCADGYILHGFTTSICLSGGRWSIPPPKCLTPTCKALAPTPSLNFTTILTTNQLIIKYSCNPGYIMDGFSESSCLSTGTWAHPLPTCSLPEWSQWNSWALCSIPCGQEVQSRTQVCRRGNVTSKCDVLLVQERLCEADPCPLNSCTKHTSDSLLSLLFISVTYLLLK